MVRVGVRRRSDRANLQLYYVDELTGADVTKSASTADWDEAQRAAAKWEAELAAATPTTAITWESWRERYESEHLSGLAPNTQDAASAALNHFERIMGSPRRMGDVTSSVVSRFVGQLRAENMKESTIGAHLGHLRVALRWSARLGFLDRPPHFPTLRLGDRTLMRGRSITRVEYGAILRATLGVRPQDARQWVRFQVGLWLSGLRLGEAVAITWDRSAFCVDLSGQRPRFRIHAEAQKSRRDSLLPTTPAFARLLLATPEDRRSGRVFPLVDKRNGQQMTNLKNISRCLSAIGERAGVLVNEDGKYASAHDFRRAFGTRWATRVKPLTLKLLMRHASIRTTLRYYVDLDAGDVEDEVWGYRGA